MKKCFYLIVSVILLLSVLTACSQADNVSVTDEADVVKFFNYSYDGWGVGSKKVTGRDAKHIISCLESLEKTGEKAGFISDIELKEGSGDYPCSPGTTWVEAMGKIYRISPGFDDICIVETHFGKGEYLSLTDDCKTALVYAYQYWPYDYWLGSYQNGKLELSNKAPADSDYSISVKDIKLSENRERGNTITLEIVSKVDVKEQIILTSQQSEDNLSGGDVAELDLKAGEAQEVTLTFGGFSYGFYITVTIGNTRMELNIAADSE